MAKELKVAVSLDLRDAERQMREFTKSAEKSLQGLQAGVSGGGQSATASQASQMAQKASAGGGGARMPAPRGMTPPSGGGGGMGMLAGLGKAGLVGAAVAGVGLAAKGVVDTVAPGALSAISGGIGGTIRGGIRSVFGSDGVSEFGAAGAAIDRAKGTVGGLIQNAPDISQDQINDLLGAHQKIYEPGQRNLQRLNVGVDEKKSELLLQEINETLKGIRAAFGA